MQNEELDNILFSAGYYYDLEQDIFEQENETIQWFRFNQLMSIVKNELSENHYDAFYRFVFLRLSHKRIAEVLNTKEKVSVRLCNESLNFLKIKFNSNSTLTCKSIRAKKTSNNEGTNDIYGRGINK